MHQFEIIDTPFIGLKKVVHLPLEDKRGSFERTFCAEELFEAGWTKPIQQINKTYTKKSGTVRGMHYQLPPHAEYKFVSCIKGKIFDVVIDLRKQSKTFLKSFSIELSPENKSSLLIPEGFAHGFQTLKNDVEMFYLHSASYVPDSEASINPTDPLIKIDWPLVISEISDRDKNKKFLAPNFAGIE